MDLMKCCIAMTRTKKMVAVLDVMSKCLKYKLVCSS